MPPFGNGTANTAGPMDLLNSQEAILGFIAYLTTKTKGVMIESGNNPRNMDELVVIFSHANKLPKARVNWNKLLHFPE